MVFRSLWPFTSTSNPQHSEIRVIAVPPCGNQKKGLVGPECQISQALGVPGPGALGFRYFPDHASSNGEPRTSLWRLWSPWLTPPGPRTPQAWEIWQPRLTEPFFQLPLGGSPMVNLFSNKGSGAGGPPWLPWNAMEGLWKVPSISNLKKG